MKVALRGLVPPPPRAAAPRVLACRRSPAIPARGRRAGRAGHLLRLRRDLQRRTGGRRARARRSQGRARSRNRRAGAMPARTPAASSRSRKPCDAGSSCFRRSTPSSSSTPPSEISSRADCRDRSPLASSAWPSGTSSETSRSSRTSITARRRSWTPCCGNRARFARTRTSPSACSTRWISSARGHHDPGQEHGCPVRRDGRSTSSTPRATRTSAARSSVG